MAVQLKDPRFSDRWGGAGAAGRWIQGGQQSEYPEPYESGYSPLQWQQEAQYWKADQLRAHEMAKDDRLKSQAFQQMEPDTMRNWEKLTPFEQNMLDRLPGVADNTAVQWISNFAETPFGDKLFKGLDYLADLTEQTAGFGFQLLTDDHLQDAARRQLWSPAGATPEDRQLARAAWQASKLFYESVAGPLFAEQPSTQEIWDMTRAAKAGDPVAQRELDEYLKEMDYRKNQAMNLWKGEDYYEYGGLPALVNSRMKLLQGMDMEQVRAEHIEELGALAIRGQMVDALGHMTLDPLNVIAGAVKPVELVQATAAMARVGKVAPEVITGLNQVDEILELAKTGARSSDEIADMLQAAGKTVAIDDVVKPLDEMADVLRKGGGIDDLAPALGVFEETAQKVRGLDQMTYLERAAVALSGGDPLNPGKWDWRIKIPGKERTFGINPVALSPKARAEMLVNTMYDNMRILVQNSDDPVEWASTIKKGAAGAFGGTFGHMFVSQQGRAVQAVLKQVAARTDDLIGVWNATTPVRGNLEAIARMTGMELGDVVNAIRKPKSAKALLQTIDRAGRAIQDAGEVLGPTEIRLLETIRNGAFTQDHLFALGRAVAPTASGTPIPLTKEMMAASFMDGILEDAARVGINKFGVQSKSVFTKAADALKSGESLVLLGMNPKYATQNFFNNEITMTARGLGFGSMSTKDSLKILDEFGFIPARAREAYTAMGEVVPGLDDVADAALGGARRLINDALTGEPGKLDTINQAIRNINNPLDMRTLSGGFEQRAGAHAYAVGMLEGWKKMWQPGAGFDHIDDWSNGLSDALRQADPLMYDHLVDQIKSAKTPADIDAIIRAQDMSFNAETVLREAAQSLGMDADEVMGVVPHDMLESINIGIKQLGDSPDAGQVEMLFDDIARNAQVYLDNISKDAVEAKVTEVATRAAAEGPNAAIDTFGDIAARVWDRQQAHMSRLDNAVPELNKIADPKARNAAWKMLKAEASDAWNRTWEWHGRTLDGLEKGLAEAGAELHPGFRQGFDTLRDSSQNYISMRNRLWDDFWKDYAGMTDEIRMSRAIEINETLDAGYIDLMETTHAANLMYDNVFTQFVTDPRQQAAVQTWRKMIRDAKKADMEELFQFRRSLRGLGPQEKSAAWREFHLQRAPKQAEIFKLEKAGKRIVEGNEDALSFFGQPMPIDPADTLQDVYGQLSKMGDTLTGHPVPAAVDDWLAAPPRPDSGLNRDAARWLAEQDPAAAEVFEDLLKQQGRFLEGLESGRYRGESAHDQYQALSDDVYEIMEKVAAKASKKTAEPGLLGTRPNLNRKIANAFGVPTATADGRPLDKVLIATMNKYYNDAAGQPMDELAQAAEDLLAQTDEFGGFSDDVIEQWQMPSDMLPEEVLLERQASASEMLDELLQSEGQARIMLPEDEAPNVGAFVTQTDNPPWRDALIERGLKDRQTTENAIRRIVEGTDTGRYADGKYVRAIREELLNRTIQQRQAMIQDAKQVSESFARPFERIEDIAPEDLVQALVYRATQRGEEIPVEDLARVLDIPVEDVHRPTGNFLAELDDIVKPAAPIAQGMDDLFFTSTSEVLQRMKASALGKLDAPKASIGALDETTQARLTQYLDHVKGQMAETRSAANAFAQARRDSALLNYSKTYNYDSWLSNLAPFQFWYTHSVARWAVHSIDRPAMLANYLRMSRFMNSAVGDRSSIPSRIKGRFKINLPFVPAEMGELWLDPYRMVGLPFEQLTQPYTSWAAKNHGLDNRAERQLRAMQADGTITKQELDAALQTRSGVHWETAVSFVQENDESMRFDLFDFMAQGITPHLPIQMAIQWGQGETEDMSPLPPTRNVKMLANLLGIDPGRYNDTWGNVRQTLGLPAFDKWQDYRIDRELSNMAAEGVITSEEAMRAMIDRDGDIFTQAEMRTNKSQGVSWLTGMFGLPITAYPEGEQKLRSQYDDFYAALDARDNGDVQQLTDFFNEHPEFETRLALFKSPEERMKTFMTDQLWTAYNAMPSLNRSIMNDAMPEDFKQLFLNKETRDLSQVTPEQMAVWLKLMGGDPVGGMGEDARPLILAPPADAAKAQTFYDYRKYYFQDAMQAQGEYFKLQGSEAAAEYLQNNPDLQAYWAWRDAAYPGINDVQDAYYDLGSKWEKQNYLAQNPQLIEYWEKRRELFPDYKRQTEIWSTLKESSPRDKYLDEHPELKAYWGWRNDWLQRNPALAVYIDDNFEPNYGSIEELRAIEGNQPNFTWREWQFALDDSQQRAIVNFIDGQPLTPAQRNDLEDRAEDMGMTLDDLLAEAQDAFLQEEPNPAQWALP